MEGLELEVVDYLQVGEFLHFLDVNITIMQ